MRQKYEIKSVLIKIQFSIDLTGQNIVLYCRNEDLQGKHNTEKQTSEKQLNRHETAFPMR